MDVSQRMFSIRRGAAIRRWVQQAHWLSIDVALGAFFSHGMAVRLPDGQPREQWATSGLLALCVFLIYAVDRQFDIHKGGVEAATPRHRFHAHHRFMIRRYLLAVGVVAGLLLFFVPGGVIRFGLVLAAVCALYVWGVWRLPARHPLQAAKEPTVALLFTVGIWGSAWVVKETVGGAEVGLALLFFGLALQNILLFSLMEYYERSESSFSLATVLTPARTDVILRWLTLIIGVGSLALFFLSEDRFTQRAAVMQAVMTGVLYAIQRYPAYFLRNGRYRWIGDGVFWLPGLIL